MSSELKISYENSNDLVKVFVVGEVDIYTAQSFKEKLGQIVEESKNDLVIDCSKLNYIDSTGLGIFVGAFKKLKQDGRNLRISSLKDSIKKLFIITGLDKLFIME